MSLVLLVQAQTNLAQRWCLALNAYYDVLVVDGPKRALAAVRDGGFDVVVIDCPDDALAAFANALDQLPDAPPMVLISDSPRAPRLSTQVGAAAFLLKPCDDAELIGAVSKVIDTKVDIELPLSLFDDEPTSQNFAFRDA
ncbi:MAG: hypothetical protein IPL79_14770 [Myxococcales bacterium]|nr:hypothetical protein [Myxococcales bacterium]